MAPRFSLPWIGAVLLLIVLPLRAEEKPEDKDNTSKNGLAFWVEARSEKSIYGLSREMAMLPKGWRMAVPDCVVCFFFGESGFIMLGPPADFGKDDIARFRASLHAPAGVDFNQKALDASWEIEHKNRKVSIRALRIAGAKDEQVAQSFVLMLAWKEEMEKSKGEIEKVLSILKDPAKASELWNANMFGEEEVLTSKESEQKSPPAESPASKPDK
ncbi:MAG: hypothetical protein KIS92_16725 [Planctomycetota bacterium]|nr:hypothetical protein [Planctomycetota bacterium]